MKEKLPTAVIALLLAPVMPIAGLLGLWWAAYALLPEAWIPVAAITGLAGGILLDVLVLPRLARRALDLSLALWVAVFLFYAVGVFGFFMGVPVFNVALALPAGFVVAARLARSHAAPAEVRRASTRAAAFTTVVLGLTCTASAALALQDSHTAANLEGMLGLSFAVTPTMIRGLILIGGACLLAANWTLTALTVRFSAQAFPQS